MGRVAVGSPGGHRYSAAHGLPGRRFEPMTPIATPTASARWSTRFAPLVRAVHSYGNWLVSISWNGVSGMCRSTWMSDVRKSLLRSHRAPYTGMP